MEDFGDDWNEGQGSHDGNGQNNTGGEDLLNSRRPKSDGLFLKRYDGFRAK